MAEVNGDNSTVEKWIGGLIQNCKEEESNELWFDKCIFM